MISDTSPIIFFAKIKRFDLLKSLYGQIIISKEVEDELLFGSKPDSELIKDAIKDGLIIVKSPLKNLNLSLGKGENSVINLANELNQPLIIDDSPGCKVAQSLNIEILRTTSVIFSAVKEKLINKKQALEIINKIIDEGYYISINYYKEIYNKLK